jgi:mono/diheme cytochrome c family protein
MRRLASALVVCSPLVVGGCDVPTPLAPAEPIGTFPTWGADFATPAQQPRSLMGTGLGGAPGDAPAPSSAPASGSEATSSTGQAMPGAIKSFSGGDPALGKGLYVALCARCHGDGGDGGALPGGVVVPPLRGSALDDRAMARSIALGKGAMPSFMNDLDRDKLAAVIAYIRTLR